MAKPPLKLALSLVFLFTAALSFAASDKAILMDQINRFSRDIHMSQQSISGSGAGSEAGLAAIAKESSSLDSLKRSISNLNSNTELKNAIETFRQFSFKISTAAEQKAFRQGVTILENRLKFLAQNESPDYMEQLVQLNRMQSEFELRSSQTPSVAASKAEVLASKAQNSRQAPKSAGLLGATVQNGKTLFSVYSPAASEVHVVIFEKPADKTGRGFPLKKGSDGIWRCSIDGELYGKFYGFAASGPSTNGNIFDQRIVVSDPYALANVGHTGKSIIMKTDFTWSDQNFKTPAHKDLIVYETHVKDLTAHRSSGVSGPNRGKYLGVLEGKGTDKVLGHLVDLGITAVELLPCHEYDNNFAGVTNHWGYMTSHFFAPESSYASGMYGQGVKEFKTLVNGLHKAGIAVIMDVVFNHTAEGSEQGPILNFRGLDNPGYYRLMDDKKYYWNGSGCGNEFRSDNPMTRKLILDSLKYWAKEYHIDGFRFDLGTLIDKTTMGAIINELPQRISLIAEPWAADWKRNLWAKTDFRNTRLAKWNDDFREKIRGFASGGDTNRNDVMTVLAGSSFWWTAKPQESINYLEAHDGHTLNDLFHGDKAKVRLAATALLTAQGIPMLHEGQEFMKSKKGNHNSYDQDNEINWIDWTVKAKNKDIYDYYKGLIALRNKYENFKNTVALNNQTVSWIQPPNHRGIGYHLKGKTDIIVLLNGDQGQWITFNLPDNNDWIVISDGTKIDDKKGLATAKGNYAVPPVTGVILKNR